MLSDCDRGQGKLALLLPRTPSRWDVGNVGLEKLKIKSTKQHLINHPHPGGNQLKESKPRHFFSLNAEGDAGRATTFTETSFCFFLKSQDQKHLIGLSS